MNKWLLLLSLVSCFSLASDALLQLTDKTPKSGRFEQKKVLKILKRPFISSGYYEFSSHSELIWHTTSPVENRLLINQQGVLQSQPDGSVKPLTDDAATSQLLLALFSGDITTLSAQFEIESVETGYKLKSKDTVLRQVISSIDLVVKQNQLDTLILHEASGNRTYIQLKTGQTGDKQGK